MATFDEILGVTSPDDGSSAPKGSAERAEQYSGEEAHVPSVSSSPKPEQTGGKTSVGGYEDLFRELNPYTPPSAEEIEKEKKKQKRDAIFAAIGDGISALSNLFFTTQYAPNMYTGKNTMSERTKIRYDKLIKDREANNMAYFNGLMKAKLAAAADADRERKWKRQLELDQEARDRYNAEQEYRKARDNAADEWRQKTFDEEKRRADRNYNFQVKQHNDNVSVRRETKAATAARGVRGKRLGFSDGQGNQVSIYENVWKGSMQQVYDAMLSDLAPTDEKERKRWERSMKELDTPQKKEDYVKQNWHKSQKASQIMLTLSSIDPASMTSELNDDVEDNDDDNTPPSMRNKTNDDDNTPPSKRK